MHSTALLIPSPSLIQHYTFSSHLYKEKADLTPITISSVLHAPVVTSEVVIDIDCWDSGSSVTFIWSSWKGHLENTPLVFTLDIPLSNFTPFTFFSFDSSLHLSLHMQLKQFTKAVFMSLF